MMAKSSWIKNTIIQAIFMVLAVVLTVSVAYNSLNDQYTEYHESKLFDKAWNLCFGTTVMLSEKNVPIDSSDIISVLDLVFDDATHGEMEIIRYTLFTSDGKNVIATNREDGFTDTVPEAALAFFNSDESGTPWSGHVFGEDYNIEIYSPVITDEGAILGISANYAPFLEFGADILNSLYMSLIYGCLIMVTTFVVFSIHLNRKSRRKGIVEGESPKKAEGFASLAKTQLAAAGVLTLLSLLFWGAYLLASGQLKTYLLFLTILLLAVAAIHLLRLLYWLLLLYLNTPVSGYSSQTLQFIAFLVTFISITVYFVQGGYQAYLEQSRVSELRQSSILAAAAFGQTEDSLNEIQDKIQTYYTQGSSEAVLIAQTQEGFAILGGSEWFYSDIELFDEAWFGRNSVVGVHDGYMYGITPVLNERYEVTALIGFRQIHSLYMDELRRDTIDFLLGMAAMVLAFIFMFVELNKLLEALSIPGNRAGDADVKYATGSRALMFFCTLCKYIPLYFFILIVESIYEINPVSWLPVEIAMILPLAIVMLMVAVGKSIVESFFKPNPRAFMMIGCTLSAAGFLAISAVTNYFIYLLFLVVTYIGLSMAFQCLWDYIWYAAKFADKYPDLKLISPNATWGEYTGYTVGAVLGAMVYDKFGLYAAMALAAAVCLVFCVLIRVILPKTGYSYTDPEEQEEDENEHGSLWRFLKSKNISFYCFLVVIPIAILPMFINQFSPVYAETLGLSPGAVSWTSLLHVLFLVFIAPLILRRIVNRFSHAGIVTMSNFVAAAALLLFAAFPGIPALFATSALVGLALGLGEDSIEWAFWEMDEANAFTGSSLMLAVFQGAGRQIGVVVFTIAYAVSASFRFANMNAVIIALAAGILLCSGAFTVFKRKKR